jgi:general secretion pathway protein N
MNAAGQRRLTPLLAIACIVFATAAVAAMSGFGDDIRWDAISVEPVHPMSAKRMVEEPVKPLTTYAEVWRKPLFTSDRSPMRGAVAAQGASLGDLELTGTIVTPGLKMALLRDRDGKREVRVREGMSLPDGHWTLSEVTSRGAVFDNGGERKPLALKTAAPAAASAATAPATPPEPSKTSALTRPVNLAAQPAAEGAR